MEAIPELKEELNDVLNEPIGRTCLSTDKPKINTFTTDPYSVRVMILKMEEDYDLSIRVYDGKHYCQICIDKGAKKSG